MVRVCCSSNCSQDCGIYGCVYDEEIYLYCEDCMVYKPNIFQKCTRRITPVKEQEATHGLCRTCAKKFLNGL